MKQQYLLLKEIFSTTLQHKDEIRQVFGQVNKGKTPETALVAGKGKKKFKKDCRICGTKGHKAADFWENEKTKKKGHNGGNQKTKKKMKLQIQLVQQQLQQQNYNRKT